MTPTDRARDRPDFGDDAPTGRKLAIICSKGNLDMAYPGLILANAALGEGVETHLFFTFWGFDMITKSRMGDLKFTMLGNTATHMPQGLGGLPGMTAMATHQMKKQIAEIGVPEVPEFLRADRRLRRPPVGLPDVRRHDAPGRGTTSTTASRASSAPPTSSRRPTAPNCCSSEPGPPMASPFRAVSACGGPGPPITGQLSSALTCSRERPAGCSTLALAPEERER